MSTQAQRKSDRDLIDDMLPLFNGSVDNFANLLKERAAEIAHSILSDANYFRRQIAVSPYERLVLAGRLISMCAAETDEMLQQTADGMTCHDVLASIEELAANVRAIKARIDVPKAAE